MLNLLLKPLLGVAGQAVSGFVETKKAKAQLKLTEVKAATKLKQDQIAGKVAWEASAVDQMKGSWKDELILICLLGLLHSSNFLTIINIYYTSPAQQVLELRELKVQWD
jgi:hypothetical protein